MRYAILLAPILLAAASASASADPAAPLAQKSCIDTHLSYSARSLNQHEVFVQNSIGKPRPPLRVKTSCINLEPAIGVRFGSSFNCLGLGDRVFATTIDGHGESCIVTGLVPYEPQKDDKKN